MRRRGNRVETTTRAVRKIKDGDTGINAARKTTILERARALGRIKHREVMELCGISTDLAYRLTGELVAEGLLRKVKVAQYELDPTHPQNQGFPR